MDSTEPRFAKGDTVIHRSHRAVGRVVKGPERDAGEVWYTVQFDGRKETLVEDDLDRLYQSATIDSLVESGQWGPLDAFRRALAIERLRDPNRNTVYSFNAQRILFHAYQYKPLLKVLDSEDRRLLIADEVGLGKTIEAGLILTELQARGHLERILVVCPSRLLQKWRQELNRKFDQDFEVFQAKDLREYMARVQESPHRSRLRAVISMQTLRSKKLIEEFLATVEDVDAVIVDEAHHARNPGTLTSAMLRDLGQIAQVMALLTATPLHLGNRDLFTLLNALRPAEFRNSAVFEAVLEQHEPCLRALALVRLRDPEQLQVATSLLRGVFMDGVGDEDRDPVATQVISDIETGVPEDRRAWSALEFRVQELHPLASIVTRTRKREVQEHAPVRRAKTYKCGLTAEEELAYRQLVHTGDERGWNSEKLTIGQIQRARQAASCLSAALKNAGVEASRDDDQAAEAMDILPSELAEFDEGDGTELESPSAAPLRKDSKLEKLIEILRGIDQSDAGAKVLVFAFFKGTVRYLSEHLSQLGYEALHIDGDVVSNPKDPSKDERGRRIESFRTDESIRVLLSTEVGSEGLDFQFCHHLVNYDLPWNPMVVEQRIGRIDRWGQESDVVRIHNLVIEGTVEDRILERLYSRIGIFEQSLGDLEAIMGETVHRLSIEYLRGELTPAESARKVEEAEQAVAKNQLLQEELERKAGDLFGHEDFIRDEMERVKRLGRFVTRSALLSMIDGFLKSSHPGLQVWSEEQDVYGVRLTDALRRDLRDNSPDGNAWRDRQRSGNLLFTMDGALAFKRPDLDLVNASHPLTKSALAALKDKATEAAARVACATLSVSPSEEEAAYEGWVLLAIYAQETDGIRKRRLLDPVAWSNRTATTLDPELAERLLHRVMEDGVEWSSGDSPPPVDPEILTKIERAARESNRRIHAEQTRENEQRYFKRKRVLEAEHEARRATVEGKLATARENEREQKVLRMFEAQLAKADDWHRKQSALIESGRTSRTSMTDAIAMCLVRVEVDSRDRGAGMRAS